MTSVSAATFSALLVSFPRPGDPLGYAGTWREGAVRRGLVPLFHTWVTGYAVAADGQVFASERDDWQDARSVRDAREQHVARAQAALMYPELASLRPMRTAADPSCPQCHGRAEPIAAAGLICECGNLGWVPSGAV
jgi:hypothetical protein